MSEADRVEDFIDPPDRRRSSTAGGRVPDPHSYHLSMTDLRKDEARERLRKDRLEPLALGPSRYSLVSLAERSRACARVPRPQAMIPKSAPGS